MYDVSEISDELLAKHYLNDKKDFHLNAKVLIPIKLSNQRVLTENSKKQQQNLTKFKNYKALNYFTLLRLPSINSGAKIINCTIFSLLLYSGIIRPLKNNQSEW